MGHFAAVWDQRASIEITKDWNGIDQVTLRSPRSASARVSLHGGQHIEAFDQNRVCTEYWKSRSRAEDFLHPLRKYPLKKQETSTLGNHQPSSVKSDVLKGLFRKANPEELCSLYSALSDDEHAADRGLVTRLLNEEIQKRMM